jgi:hypothetical protein
MGCLHKFYDICYNHYYTENHDTLLQSDRDILTILQHEETFLSVS